MNLARVSGGSPPRDLRGAARPPAPPHRGSHARPDRPRCGRRVLVGLGIVVLVTGSTTLVAARTLQGNIRTADLTPMLGTARPSAAAPNPDGGHPVNVLVMGSDSREGTNDFIGGTNETGPKSDTTLVVHLAADRSWAAAVSIPRDSMVEVPDCLDPVTGRTTPASRRMFNDAFSAGGPACTLKTVESLTGLRLDDWVLVDFSGFKDVVDALGSVPICLAEPVDDPAHGIRLPAGRSEVDGTTALAYVRERYELGDGGDLGRIDRQQAFLSSVLQRATSAGTLANPGRTYALLEALTGALVMNPELARPTRLAALARDVESVGLDRIRFATVPNGADPIDPNRLVWTGQADALWAALREDRPLQDGTEGPRARDTTAPSPRSGESPAPSGAPGTPSPPAGVILDGVTLRSADADICST